MRIFKISVLQNDIIHMNKEEFVVLIKTPTLEDAKTLEGWIQDMVGFKH